MPLKTKQDNHIQCFGNWSRTNVAVTTLFFFVCNAVMLEGERAVLTADFLGVAGELWGNRVNGTWTGMNGELGREEIDMGVANFFVSLANLEVLQFSAPYKAEVRNSSIVSKWQNIFSRVLHKNPISGKKNSGFKRKEVHIVRVCIWWSVNYTYQ